MASDGAATRVGSRALCLRLPRAKARARESTNKSGVRVYDYQSPYGIRLNPAVDSFRQFVAGQDETLPSCPSKKLLGRHVERSVGRQPAHYDNDRRQQGRKLYIPRRVHAGDIEQSDVDKSYLRRQWDYRHYGQNRQHDSICNVTQSAGRRDSSTDEAVELSRLLAVRFTGRHESRAADVRRRRGAN